GNPLVDHRRHPGGRRHLRDRSQAAGLGDRADRRGPARGAGRGQHPEL
ncbi:MAG: hypothetical protein AVDCRST_MAG52-290, partial [uncultured Blastococcus sp.]